MTGSPFLLELMFPLQRSPWSKHGSISTLTNRRPMLFTSLCPIEQVKRYVCCHFESSNTNRTLYVNNTSKESKL